MCSIPLKYLYYNDQNGRINTTYKQFQAENGLLIPEPGDSQYNKIFEKFIYQSNIQALKDTLQSIKEKGQQELELSYQMEELLMEIEDLQLLECIKRRQIFHKNLMR